MTCVLLPLSDSPSSSWSVVFTTTMSSMDTVTSVFAIAVISVSTVLMTDVNTRNKLITVYYYPHSHNTLYSSLNETCLTVQPYDHFAISTTLVHEGTAASKIVENHHAVFSEISGMMIWVNNSHFNTKYGLATNTNLQTRNFSFTMYSMSFNHKSLNIDN